MSDNVYYDGTKLLSLKDLDNTRPEIYICTTNRTGGKTTYFGRMVVNQFLKNKRKFALLYRFNYELDTVADKFFKDISGLFFPGYHMKSVTRAKGVFNELFLIPPFGDNEQGISCGYAIALNGADQIKKHSHLLSDTSCILFDEFQSETNHYCPNEITKFLSIHKSIARGQGSQYRYVPVYMIANPVSIINPYYVSMGISTRLRAETRFLKGHGYVLEQGYVKSASEAQKLSGVNKAFAKEEYIAYSNECVYLNDNTAFIEKPRGISRYLATVRYKNKDYGIREFSEDGIIFADNHSDSTYPVKISVTTDDHRVNYVMLRRNEFFISSMRYYFERGCFRFKDLEAKEAIMKLVTY